MPSSEGPSNEDDWATPEVKHLSRIEGYLWLGCIAVLLIGLLVATLGS